MSNIPVELAPVITKAWLDEEFKELLESDPAAALSQFGLSYDPSEPITVPPRPEALDMSDLQVNPDNTTPLNCTRSKMVFNSYKAVSATTVKGTSFLIKEIVFEGDYEFYDLNS